MIGINCDPWSGTRKPIQRQEAVEGYAGRGRRVEVSLPRLPLFLPRTSYFLFYDWLL
jgi:hypothetical protein